MAELERPSELEPDWDELRTRARAMVGLAYAPYSGVHVGAAALPVPKASTAPAASANCLRVSIRACCGGLRGGLRAALIGSPHGWANPAGTGGTAR